MSEESVAQQREPAQTPHRAQGLVMRNALLLVVAQVVGMPLSVLVNAAMARYLGPEEFGYIYLATTFASFGFLFVDFGQIAALPALVARERARANEFLGSGLAFRIGAAGVVYALLALASRLLGYSPAFQVALGLVVVGSTIATTTSAFQDTIRGFERADVAALGLIGQQLLSALFVVPTLLLGGGIRAALGAQALAYAVVCAFVFVALRSLAIGPLVIRKNAIRSLVSEGTPFLFLGLILVLQPNVDALFLSKLASPRALGWIAASRKLIGVLVFPAASLNSALYPTLSRLYVEDLDGYRRNVAGALRTATVIVVPIALGCALYADLGIRIFSRESFGPAEDNLRVLSLFLFLLYFSMPLGAAIGAAGLQRKWAFAQLACVGVSAAIDPILVPWFERRAGNGGLGVCVATVVSEVLMVSMGVWLVPRGIFDKKLLRGLFLALVAGAAMAGTARLLGGLNHFAAAPIAVAAYVGCMWWSGGLDREQLQALRSIVSRKKG